MSTIDRKLLELAAKAAGIAILGWYGDDGEDGEWAEHKPRQGDAVGWNPLRDDGDCFRLQVDARIRLEVDSNRAQAQTEQRPGWTSAIVVIQSHDGKTESARAAARLAVVQAAAWVGRSMP